MTDDEAKAVTKVELAITDALKDLPAESRWRGHLESVARPLGFVLGTSSSPVMPLLREPTTREAREWRRLPKHEQDRMVLEAIGDSRLTNREIQELFEEGDGPCPFSEVAAITRRMAASGELSRQHGQFGRSRIRYFRRQPEGAILALEKALQDGGEG